MSTRKRGKASVDDTSKGLIVFQSRENPHCQKCSKQVLFLLLERSFKLRVSQKKTPGTKKKTPARTPVTRSKRTRENEENLEEEEKVEISKGELEVLREIQAQWTEVEPVLKGQAGLVASLKEKTDLAVMGREEENKR